MALSALDLVDLRRVVFLVDETTDQPFLEDSLRRLWQWTAPESPNRQTTEPTIRFFHASDSSSRSLEVLYLLLLGARG